MKYSTKSHSNAMVQTANHKPRTTSSKQKQRIFILGAGGRLGMALVREWQKIFSNCKIIGLGRQELDFENPKKALQTMKDFKLQEGEVIVNSGALTDVDLCEKEVLRATTVNAITPTLLASLAAETGVRFIHLSTDYVFDGTLERPYRETDTPAPLSHYGISKLAGEQGVLAASNHHVVARVSWVFGPDRPSFIDHIIRRALNSTEAAAIHDKISSPTYTHDLAQWLTLFCKNLHSPSTKTTNTVSKNEAVRIFHPNRDEKVAKSDGARQRSILTSGSVSTDHTSQNESLKKSIYPSFPSSAVDQEGISGLAGGIYHLCNSGHCSWRDYGAYALQCAARHGVPLLTTSVAPLKLAEMKNFLAKRPVQTALDTTKFATLLGEPLRSWQDAVEEYVGKVYPG